MQLSKNPRFLREYDLFATKIDALSDDKLKKECHDLLKQLARHIADMDIKHTQLHSLGMMPSLVENTRTEVQTIRKKLAGLLKI